MKLLGVCAVALGYRAEAALEPQCESQTECCTDQNHQAGCKKHQYKSEWIRESIGRYEQINTHNQEKDTHQNQGDHFEPVHAGSLTMSFSGWTLFIFRLLTIFSYPGSTAMQSLGAFLFFRYGT
jgi:hypothetical protein